MFKPGPENYRRAAECLRLHRPSNNLQLPESHAAFDLAIDLCERMANDELVPGVQLERLSAENDDLHRRLKLIQHALKCDTITGE